jgi:hypothetical protein
MQDSSNFKFVQFQGYVTGVASGAGCLRPPRAAFEVWRFGKVRRPFQSSLVASGFRLADGFAPSARHKE